MEKDLLPLREKLLKWSARPIFKDLPPTQPACPGQDLLIQVFGNRPALLPHGPKTWLPSLPIFRRNFSQGGLINFLLFVG